MSNQNHILDMIADNSKDVYVEISSEGEKGLEKFNSINTKLNLFTKLDKGELAGNSDHFPFANKHVPSIFLLWKQEMPLRFIIPFKIIMKTYILTITKRCLP